ncbi:MAG: TSUP family transporter [Geminicoccaceae bacterium]
MIELFSFSGPEIILIAIFLFTSAWNMSVGPTGGVNFVATAVLLSPGAAVPIQALVEAAFGSYRLLLLRQFVDRAFLWQFVAGAVVGFAIGVGLRFIAAPSENVLYIIMGSLILVTAWLPMAEVVARWRPFRVSVGMITSVIGLFAGGIGALIAAAAERNDSDHRQVIATMSGSLLFHHTAKAALFGVFGFSFVDHAPLIVALLVSGLLGTWIGRQVLFDMPPHILKPTFKALVTALACYLLWKGLAA